MVTDKQRQQLTQAMLRKGAEATGAQAGFLVLLMPDGGAFGAYLADPSGSDRAPLATAIAKFLESFGNLPT